MKYKILLAGKATSIIDDFFLRMSDSFEIMTTSLINDDVLRHVKYFKPHMFLFCMYRESRDDYNKMISLKYHLDKSQVYVGIFGSQTDVTDFEHAAVNVADLVMVKPLTMDVIQSKLRIFLNSCKFSDSQDLNKNSDSTGNSNSTATPSSAANPEPAATPAPAAPTPAAAPAPAAPAPVAPAPAAPAPAAAPIPGANAVADFEAFLQSVASSQRKHILVIDDDPRMLKMMKEQLHQDFEVATAVNGKVAMKFLESKHTDLILLDYEMPDEKGPDVLAKIRSNPSTKNVPVVFLTGVTERDKIQKALVHQPQGYLLKPIDRERLMETIAKVMGG